MKAFFLCIFFVGVLWGEVAHAWESGDMIVAEVFKIQYMRSFFEGGEIKIPKKWKTFDVRGGVSWYEDGSLGDVGAVILKVDHGCEGGKLREILSGILQDAEIVQEHAQVNDDGNSISIVEWLGHFDDHRPAKFLSLCILEEGGGRFVFAGADERYFYPYEAIFFEILKSVRMH